MQTTTLNRPWLAKVLIFLVVLAFFGAYGWYDATIAYPARGERYAQTRLLEYLRAAQKEGGVLTSRVSVSSPREELARLRGATRALSEVERTRLAWLESLSVIGRDTPDRTAINEPEKTFKELEAKWATSNQPKPLEWYDIPVQWVFVAVGFGGALWLAGLFAAVSRVKYRWEEGTRTLHLPGGSTLTPADLEEVDKRKWDKYIVFLKVKPGHAAHGGKEVKLDLYRHAPLESWVLEMERAAFPGRAGEEGKAGEQVA